MGTLSGGQVKKLVKSGELIIEPFDEEMAQPATYDLRLYLAVMSGPI